MSSIISIIGLSVLALIILALVIILFNMGYIKAPPDMAYIISGLRKKRVIIGKAAFKVPFFERVDKLFLQLIPIDARTENPVPTADYINVRVDSVVNVKISDKEELLTRAAQNFLNKGTSEIRDIAREVLEGNIREIIGQMPLKQIVSDRQAFADKVKENAEPDLAAMGLEIVNFNVQNFYDDQGAIENLGIDNLVTISKNAAIAKANSEKEIAVARSLAQKEANDVEVATAQEIARKKNELEIQKAELKRQSDIKKAEADAAYKIQEEEQRKTVEITTANANLARQEKEIELKEREVIITERQLEASVKKEAEARKYAVQQEADAKLYQTQKNSEAELFERQKKAEADKFEALQSAEAEKARAEASRFAMENEAAGIKAKGEAEAAAIQAKAIAEAEGILKKAEAMKQYGEAAKMDMQLEAIKCYFNQLPAIAEAVAKPMGQIDKITMYGEGNTAKLTGDIMTTVNQINDGLQDSMGINLQGILSGMLGAGLLHKGNVTVNVDDKQ